MDNTSRSSERNEDDDTVSSNDLPSESAELGKLLINYLNSASLNAPVFAKEIANSHRWLQQQFFSLIIRPCIIALAENNTDGRNENAVKTCRQIRDQMDWPETVNTDD